MPHRVHRNQRSALPDCSFSSTRSTRWHFVQGGISDPCALVCGGGRRRCAEMAAVAWLVPFQGMAQMSAGGTSQAWLAAEALREVGVRYANRVRDAKQFDGDRSPLPHRSAWASRRRASQSWTGQRRPARCPLGGSRTEFPVRVSFISPSETQELAKHFPCVFQQLPTHEFMKYVRRLPAANFSHGQSSSGSATRTRRLSAGSRTPRCSARPSNGGSASSMAITLAWLII